MRFSRFSGGLWLPEGRDFAVPPDALLQATNIEYDKSGGVVGRRGMTKYNATPEAGPILSMWRHYPRTGVPKLLIATDIGSSVSLRVGTDLGGTFANATGGTGMADGLPWYHTNWPSKNLTYLANGSDTLKSFDGGNIVTVTSVGTVGYLNPVPNGPYVLVHKARLWATDPDEINYSVYASDVNDPTKFLSTNHLNVSDSQGGSITGLASWADFLLIFKNSCIFRHSGEIGTGGTLSKYTDRGCIAPKSIAATEYGIIYMAREGVYITDGVSPLGDELSHPIRSLFVGRASNTSYPEAVAFWNPIKQQYILKLDPDDVGGWILQRQEVIQENVYIGQSSRVTWNWSYHSNLPMRAGVAWDSEADTGQLTIGGTDGYVRYIDTGATDDGAPYTCTLQTVSRLLDANSRTGRAYRIKVLHRGSVALTGSLRYDQHATDDVTFSIGDTTLEQKYPRVSLYNFGEFGRFVSVILNNASDGYNFECSMIDLDVRFRNPRLWRNSN